MVTVYEGLSRRLEEITTGLRDALDDPSIDDRRRRDLVDLALRTSENLETLLDLLPESGLRTSGLRTSGLRTSGLELVSPLVGDEKGMQSTEEVFLERVISTIDAHLEDSDFSVAVLSVAVGCDRSHLFRRLRRINGQTPSALIRGRRLRRAQELLRAGAGRVDEVAYAVGFKSPAHFSNAFAHEFGERPSRFAKRSRAHRRWSTAAR